MVHPQVDEFIINQAQRHFILSFIKYIVSITKQFMPVEFYVLHMTKSGNLCHIMPHG